ncbi:MAG: hypothetical protein A2X49_09090 [Lentisphaerae bacterium GWF2_52_8]|nr:MAG: hypothetical protein A2X49_09090 [Lentisphaerae bacterium GWF2_52_8]
MKITDEIKTALREAVEASGNVLQFSKRIGVAHSTILFWLSGKTSNINDGIWRERLRPALFPYMKKKVYEIFPGEPLTVASEESSKYATRVVSAASRMNEVPVISFAQAAGFDPALEPIDDFAKGCSDETALFSTELRPGCFALSVEGDSMSPSFPAGTILLVAGGEFAERGDIVVAKIRETGQVVVKKYSRRDGIINLESLNPNGQSFEWNCKENKGYVEWMYPVLEANINLRKRRWEEHKNGLQS